MRARPRQYWHIFADPTLLQTEAARFIARCARTAIAKRGQFHIVLAGGETPRPVYERIQAINTCWAGWHVYYSDERCLPRDHPARNSRMAQDALLAHVPIPAAQVHSIPAQLGPEAGAAAYEKVLERVQEFDLVVLGLGADGHTASLFPQQRHLEENRAALPVTEAPKPPPDRVSLSAARLSLSRRVAFLIAGKEKREAAEKLQWGNDIPASHINPRGCLHVFVDAAATPRSYPSLWKPDSRWSHPH